MALPLKYWDSDASVCVCVCVFVCVCLYTGAVYIHLFALSRLPTYLILLIRQVGCATLVYIPDTSGVSVQVNSHV